MQVNEQKNSVLLFYVYHATMMIFVKCPLDVSFPCFPRNLRTTYWTLGTSSTLLSNVRDVSTCWNLLTWFLWADMSSNTENMETYKMTSA